MKYSLILGILPPEFSFFCMSLLVMYGGTASTIKVCVCAILQLYSNHVDDRCCPMIRVDLAVGCAR